MCNFYNYFKCLIIFLVTFYFCLVYCEDPMIEVQEILGELLPDLYSQYKDAAGNNDTLSLRRLLKNDREFKIHVKKLKNVNGLKTHNLRIEEVKSEKNPIIYINNPVESKLPKTYLTLEEFKKALADRVNHQRKEFKFEKRFKLKSINKTVIITREDLKTTTVINSRNIAKLKDLNTNKSISEEVNETEVTLIETTIKDTTKNYIDTSTTTIIDETTLDLTTPPSTAIYTINDNFTSLNSIISTNISTTIDPPSTINGIVSYNDTSTTSKLDLTMEDSKNESYLATSIDDSDYFTLQSTTETPNSDISTTIDPTSTTIDPMSTINGIVSYNDTRTTSKLDLRIEESKNESCLTTSIDESDNFTIKSTTETPYSDISTTIDPTSTTIDPTSTINDIVSNNYTVATSKLDVTEDVSAKTNDNQESLREETSPIVITSSSSKKPRKITLGRPLVFMGGYN